MKPIVSTFAHDIALGTSIARFLHMNQSSGKLPGAAWGGLAWPGGLAKARARQGQAMAKPRHRQGKGKAKARPRQG